MWLGSTPFRFLGKSRMDVVPGIKHRFFYSDADAFGGRAPQTLLRSVRIFSFDRIFSSSVFVARTPTSRSTAFRSAQRTRAGKQHTSSVLLNIENDLSKNGVVYLIDFSMDP